MRSLRLEPTTLTELERSLPPEWPEDPWPEIRARLASNPHTLVVVDDDPTDQPVWQLSGGNQQKVVVGRWLATRPRLLLLYDPTRGIDVGAKREIHRLCDALAREGLGILLTSSELEEVVGLSDRVLAFHRGRAVRAFGPGEATREALLRCILGAGEPAMQGAEERGGPTHG